ncbi:MAG: AAA family ATPase [Desulfomonilaceae bacterium]
MLNIAGCNVIDEIYESNLSRVLRAVRVIDYKQVILKIQNSDHPTIGEIVRYKHEYRITRSLENLLGVPKICSLERDRNRLAIIFEDIGATSLDRLKNSTPFSLEDSIILAIQICGTLGQIHSEGIIHKDLNPSNIVLNPISRQLKIIDFGISTWMTRENTALANPNTLEGSLAYMSPEQTGRMNRLLDYRSDYYSLGVTLYELFTGKLPFDTADPLELVHCHIARKPKPPIEVNPVVPEPISNVIIKLLSKNAESRYQSIHGLQADLEQCLTQIQQTGRIKFFEVARSDISEKLEIPQRLYGREEQTEILVKAFFRVVGGAREISVVSGRGGIGKTSLVKQLYKSVTSQRGYFISGKFDRFRLHGPYNAILAALREFMLQILGEDENRIGDWKCEILNALGVSAQVIIEVIPELELIVGPQPRVSSLEPLEARNRFFMLFQSLMRVLCRAEHPLVMFLDDVQWADSSSLKLLELILTDPDTKCLLLIVAFRDNETGPYHPLTTMINTLEGKDVVTNLHLGPLQIEHVTELIADTLQTDMSRVEQLAGLVYHKTTGNPFYLKEFVNALYEQKLLEFDFERGRWQWNVPKIREQKISDNVVDLVEAKILRLPTRTQNLLKVAGCVGNLFGLHILSWAIHDSLRNVAVDLKPAISEGLVFPVGTGFKSVELEIEEANPSMKLEYQFAHDRIQYAAYSLIPENERALIHRKLARLLLENTAADSPDDHIFDVVDQFNSAFSIVVDDQERSELAELNLRAGKKANTAMAYEDAFLYFQAGLNALVKDSWERNYNLTLELHVEAVQAAYLATRFSEIERLVSYIIEHARTLLDKVKVYEVRIQAFIAQNKRADAVRTSLEILNQLGEKFPVNPNKLNVMADFMKTRLVLSVRRVKSLVNLPEMTDQKKLAAMRVLRSVISASYTVAPNLFALMAFKMVRLSARYGKARQSGVAFAAYAIILCSIIGDADSGYRYGAMALELVNRDDIKEDLARVNFAVYSFIRIWRDPLRDTLEPLLESFHIGLEVGDLEYAALSAAFYCTHSYGVGKDLPELEKEIAKYDHLIGKLKQDTTRHLVQVYRQEVLNLMVPSENPCNLAGSAFDEDKMLPILYESNERAIISAIFIQKLRLCYLFYDYQASVEYGAKAQQYLDGTRGSVLFPVAYFYYSLGLLSVFAESNPDERKAILRKVNSYQKQLENWSSKAPTNYMHKFLLVESERFRVLGRNHEAKRHYELAIAKARQSQYLNEEALAHERAGIFYLSTGDTLKAQNAIEEARNCYLTWGAMTKVKHLNETYPELLSEYPSLTPSEFSGEAPKHRRAGSSTEENIDLTAVLRASQTLSSEIIFENLLTKMMSIVIQIGGAEKGFLILEKEGSLYIEARTSILNGEHFDSSPVQVVNSKELPSSVVNFVSRTCEPVILDDAQSENPFVNDNYVREKGPKSVLCLPIMRGGRSSGVLYLENNQATGAFTAGRVEMLKVISAQAAISIENAKLYRNLEESAAKYRSLFENAQEAIFIAQDGYVRFFNPRFIDLSGCSSQEVSSQPLASMVYSVDQSILSEQQTKSLGKESTPNIASFRIVRKDSTEVWVQNNSIGVDWLGRPATLNFLTDITDIKKASDLNVRTERLKAIADLAGGVAHNFNNVLQVVISGSELALDDLTKGNTSRVRTNLERIRDSSIFGADTVKRLQSFAKVRSEDTELENNLFDLSKIVRQAADISRPWWKTNLEKKGLQIKMGLNLKDGCMVLGKESELFEVLINLIKNAAEAMPDGGNINISTRADRDDVVLELQDTGTGIPESDLKKMFEPFWTTKGAMGTGLGLAVSHGIISSHGGTISVDSKFRYGTTFTIKLPLSKASVQEISSSPTSILDLNLKVLVIDDTEPILTLMRDMLTGYRQTVLTAKSGAEGLDIFKNHEIDIVICDLGMPGMSGWEVGKMVRSICGEKGIPKTPFLLLTGWGGQSLGPDKIVESGIDGVLEKPIHSQSLLGMIRKVAKKQLDHN